MGYDIFSKKTEETASQDQESQKNASEAKNDPFKETKYHEKKTSFKWGEYVRE